MKLFTPLSLILCAAVMAQPPAPNPAKPKRPGGFGPNIKAHEEAGFESLFDGATLKGWDGDPAFWRVEDGALVGQTTVEKQPVQNTFLIWRGGYPANFELKLQYKLTGFNSGIQYRSIELPDIKYAMKGYQADMDGRQQFTGQIYEERGRGFLALRGQSNEVGPDQKAGNIGTLGTSDELKALIKQDDWNELHIIARGHTLIQILNGRVMRMLVDPFIQTEST